MSAVIGGSDTGAPTPGASTTLRAPVVAFERVSKSYRSGAPVIDNLSFTIERSTCVLLTGPCGAGKSTVLRLIAGFESPTAGTVAVAGENVARLSSRALAFLRRSIGIVPQRSLLLDDRSVLDNVALPAQAAGLSRAMASERAAAALQRVGIDAALHRSKPRSLAGGEQQRVALARAIVNRPALLLADEPTAHLDAAASAQLAQLLSEFVTGGVTLIVAGHSPLSLPISSRLIELAPPATA